MNWLRVLLGISALLVAGCAAYFSVTGLGLLFSGASGAVMIMAGSLELAKLVSATYLKQKWDEIKGLNKWYLTISVVILMLITSAGIFGFLSNAFQQQNIRLQQVEREINVWETKIKSDSQQVTLLTAQLNNLQTNQSKIIDGGKVNSRLLKSIDNRDKQTQKIQDKINTLQDSSVAYNGKINEIKNKNIDLEREIGGFRFVAESFNIPLNTVVKFFIILIVFVFDPLAVALIIAFNQLLLTKNNKQNKGVNSTDEPENDLNGDVSKVNITEDDLEKLEKILLTPKSIPTKKDEALNETKNKSTLEENPQDFEETEYSSNDYEYIPTPEEEKMNYQEYNNFSENHDEKTVFSNNDPEVNDKSKFFSTKDEKQENIFQEKIASPIVQNTIVEESNNFISNEIDVKNSEIVKEETPENVIVETKPKEIHQINSLENIKITPSSIGEKKK
jgi:hypothetical protein